MNAERKAILNRRAGKWGGASKKPAGWRLAFVAAIIAVSAIFQGCGGGGAANGPSSTPRPSLQDGMGGATVTVAPKSGAHSGREGSIIPASSEKIVVSVSGQGLASPKTVELTGLNDVSSATILNIPAGVKTISVSALDGGGAALATREQIVTILAGKIISVHATLGFTYDGSTITPSSIDYGVGDAIVIRNTSSTAAAVSVPGLACGQSTIAKHGQVKCHFTAGGAYSIHVGSANASANVSAGSVSSLKAAIGANQTYGSSPLTVVLLGNRASADASSPTAYLWDFGGGALVSGYSQSQDATAAVFSEAGDYVVELTVTQGGQTATDQLRITVVEAAAPAVVGAAAPVVLEISPPDKPRNISSVIAIFGQNFQEGAQAFIDNRPVATTFVDDSELSIIVQVNYAEGTYTVKVDNPDGQSGSLESSFTVTGPQSPVVSQVSPMEFISSEGGTISIYGSNFDSGATVWLDARNLVVVDISPTKIDATVPVGLPAGTYSVSVRNSNNWSGALLDAFTVVDYTHSTCPPVGPFWLAEIGGDGSSVWSSSGQIEFSLEGRLSTSGLLGTSLGSSNVQFANAGDAFPRPGGNYAFGFQTNNSGGKAELNNDCSVGAYRSSTQGQWSAMYFARKGSSLDYEAVSPDGSWFAIMASVEGNSNAVAFGDYAFSGGDITGTERTLSNVDASESTVAAAPGDKTYTYDSTTGEIALSSAMGETYVGGLSFDGNIIILATTATPRQSIMLLIRKPDAFDSSSLYGEWRGVGFCYGQANAKSHVAALKIGASDLYSSEEWHSWLEGNSFEAWQSLSASFVSVFSSSGDGAGMDGESGCRFGGEGETLIAAQTILPSSDSCVDLYFKTDISAPLGNPPTANAGVDQTATVGATVTLDGSASYDPDGDSLEYVWGQLYGPAVYFATTNESLIFVPTATGTYRFGLSVTDSIFWSHGKVNEAANILDYSDDVVIEVTAGP